MFEKSNKNHNKHGKMDGIWIGVCDGMIVGFKDGICGCVRLNPDTGGRSICSIAVLF